MSERFCPNCRRLIAVKQDGTFVTHSQPKPAVAIVVCPLSRTRPEEIN